MNQFFCSPYVPQAGADHPAMSPSQNKPWELFGGLAYVVFRRAKDGGDGRQVRSRWYVLEVGTRTARAGKDVALLYFLLEGRQPALE